MTTRLPRAAPAWLRHVLLPFLATRLAWCCTVALASPWAHGAPRAWLPSPSLGPWDALVAWDSLFYLEIAERGHADPRASQFFPGYPWWVRVVGLALPLPWAAVTAAHLSWLVALSLLFECLRADEGEAVAARAVLLSLLFPTSFFFGMAYAESTLLACLLGAWLAVRRGHAGWAASLAAYAVLTRPTGLPLLLALPLGAWLGTGRSPRAWAPLLSGSLAGVLLLLAHYRLATGDAWSFLDRGLQAAHGAHVDRLDDPVAQMLREGAGPLPVRRLLNWGAVLLALAAAVAALRARRLDLAAVAGAAVLVPIAVQRTWFDATSMSRYVLVGYPVYWALARWRPTPGVVDVGFAWGQLVLTVAFAAGVWVE